MRLHKIKSMLDTNRYLQLNFLPLYWSKRNTVVPKQTENRYRPLPAYLNLDQIICIREKRIVASDHCVAYLGKRYKITERRFGSLKGKEVTVNQSETGDISLFHGHIQLKIEEVKKVKRRWESKTA